MPVVEGRIARGILVADRVDARKFEPADVALVESAAAQVVRVVQSERVFQALERSKHEHERFYSASAELNRALTLDQVYDAAIAGARGVCEFDFAAIATYEARRGSHTIRRVVGEGADKLLGTSHKDPSSIASMVAKNKLALPAGGDWHERDVPVFSHPMRIKDYESLLVVPLIVKDEVIGTFTVAAMRVGAFPSDRRDMLGVIANQVAVSMQNARMYEALEEQATTDGLTGLVNHRTFQERFAGDAGPRRAPRAGGVAAADRHRPLQEDQRQLRPPDRRRGAAPGRRDPEGERAQDRHRRALRRRGVRAGAGGDRPRRARSSWPSASARRSRTQSFPSSKGSFGATLSIGVASYPDDSRDKPEIIARADQALYSAKHGGRNRTVCFADIDRKLKVAERRSEMARRGFGRSSASPAALRRPVCATKRRQPLDDAALRASQPRTMAASAGAQPGVTFAPGPADAAFARARRSPCAEIRTFGGANRTDVGG